MKINTDPIGSLLRVMDKHVRKLQEWHPHFAIVAKVGNDDWRFLERLERRRVPRLLVRGGRFVPGVVTEYREVAK